MTKLGAILRPQTPPELLREATEAADAAGLDELWLWEDCFLQSGIASAAAALAWTQHLEVGVGLLPVPLRNVALTAMEIATLDRMFPGRLHVAVGHGVQSWMGQAGARVESPMTLLREHVTALRSLLCGELVTANGRYVTLDGVQLGWPPAQSPPIHVGATGPRTLRLAGELADGTVLTGGTSPAQVTARCRLVEEGREAGGSTDPHRVTVYLLAATGADAGARLHAEVPPDDEADEPLWVAGDARTVADAVDRWAAAGADAVILQPTGDEPDPIGFVRFVAEQVSPLVSL
ncbi:LLM class flavin-dependent oxidoreductase [Nitriliruptor alkaliphilus]|uniref:LLM class flavin-dependent oxidoreductase n=1 Tax=Nitriliruptor alkaliphilus TaxID=427918 RepID=UPI000697323D|nr:LLM class flavin-dependent oxidoreductase [Nitriliruptor alkaliphilus]